MSTTSDRLGKQATSVTENLQEMGDIAKDAAQKKLGQMREQASAYYQQGQDQVQGVVSAFEHSVSQRPIRSVLIAAGVGLLLDRLWHWMRR